MSMMFKTDYTPPRCAVEGCRGDAAWRVPFCLAHWRAIPERLRNELKRYRKSDPLMRRPDHVDVLAEAGRRASRGIEAEG